MFTVHFRRVVGQTVAKSELVAPPVCMERMDLQKYDWTSQDWGIKREIQPFLVSCRLKS
jgi:hypothetical protein